MAGIFDRLHRQIGGSDEDTGISPLDLRDLPPRQRWLMRLMIREVEMPYHSLRDALEDMPSDIRMTPAELDEVLTDLVRQRWLIRYGEEKVTYEANLRRKAGSEVAKSIWSTLDSRIAEQRRLREEAAADQEDD
jgi:hypothetical protein